MKRLRSLRIIALASMAPVTVEMTFMDKAGRTTQRLERVHPERYAGKELVIRER